MATTLTSKPLDFFKPDPGNPRKSFLPDEMRVLHDSLGKKQLVPLLAKPDGTIIDGWRRWCAAKLDGKPERLDVIITDEPLTPAQIKEIQLVTALHRADLKPYEQFLGCRDWLALNPGATAKDLAAKIDRDPSTLVRILSLSKCIRAVQQAAADGKARAFGMVRHIEGAGGGAASHARGEAGRRQPRPARTAGPQASQWRGSRHQGQPAEIPLGPQGRSVTIAGSNLSLDDAIEMLQETLKFARKAQGENLDGKTWVQVMKQKAKQ